MTWIHRLVNVSLPLVFIQQDQPTWGRSTQEQGVESRAQERDCVLARTLS